MVGQKQAELFNPDPQNLDYMKWSVVANQLDDAMHFAYKVAKTDNVIIFDGAMGGINVSESLGELLVRKAPEVSARVDWELMPRWLKQRGVASKAEQRELAAAKKCLHPTARKCAQWKPRSKGVVVQTAARVQQDIRRSFLPASMAGNSAPESSPKGTEL